MYKAVISLFFVLGLSACGSGPAVYSHNSGGGGGSSAAPRQDVDTSLHVGPDEHVQERTERAVNGDKAPPSIDRPDPSVNERPEPAGEGDPSTAGGNEKPEPEGDGMGESPSPEGGSPSPEGSSASEAGGSPAPDGTP